MSSGARLAAQSDAKIHWLSWEEAIELSQNEKKKIFIDVYTDWCGWCKKMDASTFQQKYIADYINENYYAIKFNAEQKESIELNGTVYKFVKSGRRGYHELAASIMRGKMSYPTVVFLDENYELIQPIPGFRDAKTFEMIMTYFGEDHHTNMPWKKYESNYVSPFKYANQP
jgi:thioredoxin-related protein